MREKKKEEEEDGGKNISLSPYMCASESMPNKRVLLKHCRQFPAEREKRRTKNL